MQPQHQSLSLVPLYVASLICLIGTILIGH